MVSVSAGTLLLIFTPHSVRRFEHTHAVQLGAVLSILHVAVGPSGIMRVNAIALFAQLGGATGPYLPLAQECRSLKYHVIPALAASFLASF